MFKKRWHITLAAFAGLASMGILVPALLPMEPEVTRANFKRVKVGMTQAEAQAIFGVPPSDTAPNGRDWSSLRYA